MTIGIERAKLLLQQAKTFFGQAEDPPPPLSSAVPLAHAETVLQEKPMNEQHETETTQLRIQQERLSALYQLSSKLGTTLDLNELLNQVMDSIIQLANAERGFVMLYEQQGALQIVAARNVDKRTIESHSMEISRTVVQRAVTTERAVLTNNAQEDDRFNTQHSVIGYQLRSIMCAPLLARGRVLGAVYVDNRLHAGVFEQDELELLETFTNQAAIAIQNAQYLAQTDQKLARRVEELTLFQRIDQELNRSLNLDEVLSLALEWAIELTTASSGSIGLLEVVEETSVSQLRLLAHQNRDGQSSETAVIPATHPILAQVLEQKQSTLTSDVTVEQSIDSTPRPMQLAVPIKQDGNVIGLITIECEKANCIGDEDRLFVERLADRSAVAITNARLYADIHAANKAKSDFVSLVTHELRLPLTSIKGYTDLLASGMVGQLNEQQDQFVDVIKRNLGRMSSLISDLSDINRIESGRMRFELKSVYLEDVMEDVTDTWQERAANKRQTLIVNMSENIPAILADPQRINQVMSNLVSNACKYTPENGTITIDVQPNGSHVKLAVKDSGIGISEEDQAKLFTQFFRSEDQLVRKETGWGLGLSIVKKMVEAQGGEISFVSKVGEGSTFSFTVPLAKVA